MELLRATVKDALHVSRDSLRAPQYLSTFQYFSVSPYSPKLLNPPLYKHVVNNRMAVNYIILAPGSLCTGSGLTASQ